MKRFAWARNHDFPLSWHPQCVLTIESENLRLWNVQRLGQAQFEIGVGFVVSLAQHLSFLTVWLCHGFARTITDYWSQRSSELTHLDQSSPNQTQNCSHLLNDLSQTLETFTEPHFPLVAHHLRLRQILTTLLSCLSLFQIMAMLTMRRFIATF